MEKQIRIAVHSTQTLPYEQLVEFQGDLKDLSKDAYQKLRHEIVERGFSFAIHVWQCDRDGKNYILDGHQRLRTVKQMVDKEGWATPELPVVFVEAKNLKEAKMKVLSGTSQYGQMSNEGLYEFMMDSEISFEDLESFQFPEIDLVKFNEEFFVDPAGDGEYDPKEDEVPTITKIKRTKRGELFTLGRHKLYCGDATSESDLAVLMGNEKADLVITDPPYNVDYVGGNHSEYNRPRSEGKVIDNDKMDDDKFREFLFKAFSAMNAMTKPGGGIYVAHSDSMGYHFRGALVDAGFLLKQCLIWVKNSLVMGRQDYHWRHEPILYGWKAGASHHWHTDRKQTTVIEIDRPTKNDLHPTMKPIALIEYLMGNSSQKDELVLDTFGGSGSTLIAAEKNGRRCNLVELDPHYCDVILERWALYTGLDPVRSDGIPWSKIKTQRTRETKTRKVSSVAQAPEKSVLKKGKASVKPAGAHRTTRT